MQLHYWSGFSGVKNFGDELNPVIWKKMLPEAFDDNPDELFIGIGTVLNNRIPKAKKTIIMGSGVGYGDLPPQSVIDTWSIYCLRGKLSAQALGVSSELVATDPAILVHQLYPGDESKTHDFAYMPHYTTMGDSLRIICANTGIRLIDPLDTVDNVIKAMKQSKVIIAEAMHAAIVADALRIPWIAVHSPFHAYSPFKWEDWCSSLNVTYKSYYINRLWPPEEMCKIQPKHIIKKILNPLLLWKTEKRLRDITKENKTVLSGDSEFSSALQKFVEAVGRFKYDHKNSINFARMER